MKRLLLIIVYFLTFSHFAYSERTGYDKTVNISVESENYRIEHYHDWSIGYAYIECINKNTNVAVFKISSPTLTNLFISYIEETLHLSHYSLCLFTFSQFITLEESHAKAQSSRS